MQIKQWTAVKSCKPLTEKSECVPLIIVRWHVWHMSSVFLCVYLRKKCFAAFWCGNLHSPASKDCTSHMATNHVLPSVTSHCPDTVWKATPHCLWTPNKGLLHLCFLMLKSQGWLQNWNSQSLVTENLIRCSFIAAVQITFLTNTTSSKMLSAIKSLT